MNNDYGKFILVAAAGFIICIFLYGRNCGMDIGMEDVRREAVSKGHAIYNCSPLTGECKFEWK